MSQDGKRLLAFGDFELDREERLLYRHGERVPLSPKAFQTLAVLVESRGRLLTKEQLMKAIWPETFVEEHNLTLNVHALRKALNRSGDSERYIETVPRRGYRLIAPVTERSRGRPAADAAATEGARPPASVARPRRTTLVTRIAVVVTLATFGLAAGAMRLRRAARVTDAGPEPVRLTHDIADDRQPDVSPDGRTVLFVTNRDGGKDEIYAMDADGGNLRNLTHNDANDGGPAWSPDGTRIAFESDRRGVMEIFVMAADGRRPVPLAVGGRAAWSPDGGQIAFQRSVNHHSEIFMIDSSGGEARQLTSDRGFCGDPSFAPDGAHMAFTSSVGGQLQVGIMRIDGTERKILTTRGQNTLPVWSREGRILFNSNRDGVDAIYVMTADGAVQHPIEYGQLPSAEGSWWPDGRAIAFESNRDGNLEIYRQRLDREPDGAVRLTRHVADDENPSWAPDGKQIAFDSNRDGKPNICVMDADGGGVRNLTRGSARDSYPSWSSDGTRIAFVSDRGGASAIYEMRADGSNVRRITGGTDDRLPHWSPDDSRICFLRGGDIWVQPVAGGAATRMATGESCAWASDGSHVIFDRDRNQVREIYSIPVGAASTDKEVCLTRNGKGNGGPAVSRDGARIAFNSNQDGFIFGIFLMNADGSGQLRISGPTTFDEHPAWSPDGHWIAFTSSRDGNNEIYKLPVR